MPVQLPQLPPDNTSICVVIPNSAEWRQLYLGALLMLQKWWYYDVDNEVEAEDVVQRVMSCHYLTTHENDVCDDMNCEDLINCLYDNPDLLTELTTALTSGGDESIRQATWKDDNFSAEVNGSCDDDLLYGIVDAVIDYIHATVMDWLETWEQQTNIVEFIGVAEDIPFFAPLLDALGTELATEYVEFVFDSVAENYLAIYTEVLEDELECELFCFIKEGKGCEVSITDIAQFYADKMLYAFSNDNLASDIISYLIAGTWTGNQYVYAMHLAISGVLAVDKLVAGRVWNSFQRAVLLAEPSIEHTFCPPCNVETCIQFNDFSPVPLDWTVDHAQLNSGGHLIGSLPSGGQSWSALSFESSSVMSFVKLRLKAFTDKPETAYRPYDLNVKMYDGATLVHDETQNVGGNASNKIMEFEYEGDVDKVEIYFTVWTSNVDGGYGGLYDIQFVVGGAGYLPTGDACDY